MRVSESRGRRDLDSQGDLEPENGTDTCAARKPTRRPRRVCIGDSGGSAGLKRPDDHNAVYRETEPRVIFGNRSSYRVSYWVVEEDKYITALDKGAHAERLVGSMTRYLNGSSNIERKVGPTKQEDARDKERDGVYFLTRDHRMEPRGATQATKVPFSLNCREMRGSVPFSRKTVSGIASKTEKSPPACSRRFSTSLLWMPTSRRAPNIVAAHYIDGR